MIYYLIFLILMPSFTYIDYKAYKKRMLNLLKEQPDYEDNIENYIMLHDKLCARQKKSSTLVCTIICIVALLMLLLSIRAMEL